MATTRTWWKGAIAAFRASVAVPTGGDLVTTTDGRGAVGDGTTALKNLPTFVTEYDLPLESGALRAEVDSTGRIIRLVLLDGSTSFTKLLHAVNSVPRSALASDVIALLPSDLALEAGYVWAIVDSVGRVLLGIQLDGTVVGKFSVTVGAGSITETQLSASVLAKLNSGGTGGASFRDVATVESGTLWARWDGSARQRLSAVGHTVANVRQAEGFRGFVWDDTQGGSTVTVWARYDPTTLTAASATTYNALSSSAVTIYGTSLAKAHDQAQVGLPSVIPGVVVNNAAVSSSTSTLASIWAGANTLYVKVPGGTIPADLTPVTLTFDRTSLGTSTFSALVMHVFGSLAGVPGDIAISGNGSTITFTRTTAGAAVPVSATASLPVTNVIKNSRAADTPFPCGSQFWGTKLHIGGPRNNFAGNAPWTPEDGKTDIAAVVQTQTALARDFTIDSVLNGTDEPKASSKYAAIIAWNQWAATTYGTVENGGAFWDHRRYLRDYGLAQTFALVGRADTRTSAQIAQDAADVANDCIPTSLHLGSPLFFKTEGGAMNPDGSVDTTVVVDALHFVDPVYKLIYVWLGHIYTDGLTIGGTLLIPGKGWY